VHAIFRPKHSLLLVDVDVCMCMAMRQCPETYWEPIGSQMVTYTRYRDWMTPQCWRNSL